MRRYRKQAGSSLGRRAQRGAVAMGMMAQSGRRSAFRGQTGDDDGVIGCDFPPPEIVIVGCTNPEAINFNANAMADDGSCLMLEDVCAMCAQTGGNGPVGADGIKPFEDPSTPPMGVRPFRKQTGDIPTCTMAGQALPDGAETMLNPQLSGCGVCRCQIPDGADCPDRIGQWMGGSIFNVDPSSCNCDYQSDGCVNPTGGGLLDPSLSKPTFNKLPRLRGKMRGQSGKMSRASQTGSGHKMRCGTPAGGSSNFGWEYPEPTWGFTGCDYLFGTQSECQAQCTSGPSPMRDGMKNASGRDMCGFYSNPSDAPFTG